jgi:hypothetical protein
MKTLILFVAYHKNKFLDNSYLQELYKISDDVKVLSNKPIDGINNNEIYDNEGYDFGYWYKALQKTNIHNYDRIIMVNNSNKLIKNGNLNKLVLEFNKNNEYDFWGLTDSYETPPKVDPSKSYHIQSHFLVLEKKAIKLILEFFRSINFERFFTIKNNLRQEIINNCEIGLSQYMLNKGLKLGAIYSSKEFSRKYGKDYKKTNLHVILWEELINNNYPLIKKKIVNEEWKFLKNYKNYKKYV